MYVHAMTVLDRVADGIVSRLFTRRWLIERSLFFSNISSFISVVKLLDIVPKVKVDLQIFYIIKDCSKKVFFCRVTLKLLYEPGANRKLLMNTNNPMIMSTCQTLLPGFIRLRNEWKQLFYEVTLSDFR